MALLNFDVILKLAGLGILVWVVKLLIDNVGQKEYGPLLTIAGVVAGALLVIPLLSNLLQSVKTLFNL
jgi:stage III sporulation protein AC